MPEPRPGYLLDLITTARDLDFGLLIETDNVEACRYDLYSKLRAEGIRTEDLDIQICVPSTPNTIYILKRSVELPDD
jgi:hypothetical protein